MLRVASSLFVDRHRGMESMGGRGMGLKYVLSLALEICVIRADQ